VDPAIYLVIAALLVIVGVIGTVVPVLPGVVLVFAGLFVAAQAQGFTRVGLVGLSIIGALGLLAFALDFFASVMGAKRVGASPRALAGAALGGAIGIFLGIPGLILGPFVGAFLGELWARGGFKQAGKVGIGTWLGLVFAAIAKVVIAFLMIATFFAFYLMNSPS
jgi:uncharacterized protein YqgC (DUF456 family)